MLVLEGSFDVYLGSRVVTAGGCRVEPNVYIYIYKFLVDLCLCRKFLSICHLSDCNPKTRNLDHLFYSSSNPSTRTGVHQKRGTSKGFMNYWLGVAKNHG